jgi:hypothetical protein
MIVRLSHLTRFRTPAEWPRDALLNDAEPNRVFPRLGAKTKLAK